MLDSFFAKGFKASKCKTLLKLTIPRIKLLRNRKELQIKQMRKDIAKLLETGQEATARIRVEHIIRDENMMAAQEILELFCELIAVRLPIIESQRECPLDLKEAISSICFAAPRCADLPELLQVQMSFASKYGKEFVQAAAELMPNCGVNRQLIELLSVRAPPPEKKLKLLKEIAEEHEIDWDPSPSETELFKSHEDLLNGPTNFVGGSKVPLHEEKHDEILQSASIPGADGHDDSEENADELEFPEVPKVPLRPGPDSFAAPPQPSAPHHDASQTHVESDQNQFHHSTIDPDEILRATESESHESSANPKEGKQFVPFISPPSFLQASLPVRESNQSLSPSGTKTDGYRDLNDVVAAARVAAESAVQAAVRASNQSPSPSEIKTDGYGDLNDVLAAARAAAESAERAAAAARAAASLAEVRIAELSKTKSGQSLGSDTENPFASNNNVAAATEKLHLDDRNASGDYGDNPSSWNSSDLFENDQTPNGSKHSTYDEPKMESNANKQELPSHQPQRISSMDSDTDFSYPNLFHSQSGKSNF